jgi:hypothetical protein
MIFLFKKWSIILFNIYFLYLCKFLNQKKYLSWHVYLNAFNQLSHFEKITWFLMYDGCLFLVKIVSCLILWVMDWWQSHMGLGAHLKRWEEKAKCQKMNVNSRRQNPLNLLYFIMILNTIHGPSRHGQQDECYIWQVWQGSCA